MSKGKPSDRIGRPQREYTPTSDGQGHGRSGTGSSHGYTGYVPTISPTTTDMGTGGMVMADGETEKVDLIPTRLHIGNGKDTPPCHQLCNETIESSQVRPSAMIATITGEDSKWLRHYKRHRKSSPSASQGDHGQNWKHNLGS